MWFAPVVVLWCSFTCCSPLCVLCLSFVVVLLCCSNVVRPACPREAAKPLSIKWVFCAIDDVWRNDDLNPKELSCGNITGYRSASGKGFVDELLFKRSMLDYCLDTVLSKHPFADGPRAAIRRILADHESYRRDLQPTKFMMMAGAAPPDTSFLATWPKSARMMMTFVEDIVFKRVHDGTLKTALRSRKVAEDVFEYERFSSEMVAILDQLEAEQRQQRPGPQLAVDDDDYCNLHDAGGARDDDGEKRNLHEAEAAE